MEGSHATDFSGHTIVVATQQQLSSEMAGEAVILDLRNGVYYGLDEVGARIWSLLQEPRSVNEIHKVLLDEYEVEPDDCMIDLVALLTDLAEAELIEVKSNATAP